MHRGRTVLAMDCVLAGAEWQPGRPLNSVVRPQLMTRTGLVYAAFISISVVTAVAAIIGLDVYARMTFSSMSFESAYSEVMRRLHLMPALINCAPFIVLGAMAARFGARHNFLIAILIFASLEFRVGNLASY